MTTLLAVPNISEGRDQPTIDAVAAAFGRPLLNVHSDPDHNRTVFTLAGRPGRLAGAVLDAARVALQWIDLNRHQGVHPRVGALDVAPIVYLSSRDRGAACAEALVLADSLGDDLGLPVFLYGLLSGGRSRAELRRGGPQELRARVERGELAPDFGPAEVDGGAGAVLVSARPPLVAFNLELAPPASVQDARRIAALIREGGEEGLPGVRAIGLWLEHRGVAQVSTNVEDHERVALRDLVEAIARHHRVLEAELIGLAPRAAFEGFPEDVPVRHRRSIEDALTGND